MQLERIQLVLRRRSGWEAIDLGSVMLRAWGAEAYRAWLATYLPFAALLLGCGVLWPAFSAWVPVLVWWCKPAFDRVLLFVYGRALFGTPTSIREVWRAFPGLLRNTGLLRALTIGRLSMARSFLLPIWQLEGSRGKTARERARVLGMGTRGYAVWITFFCANLSTLLGISMLLLLAWMMPQGSGDLIDWQDLFLGQTPALRLLIFNLIVQVAESIVEPLYVASGFSLYLSRRTKLEGWDIELGLRELARRKQAEASAHQLGRAVVLALVFCTALLALPAPPARAEDSAPDTPTTGAEAAKVAEVAKGQSEAKRVIQDVLSDPVFGKEVKDGEWRMRQKNDSAKNAVLPEWLKPLLAAVEFMAKGMRVLVWIGGVLLLALLIWLVWRYRDAWSGGLRRSPPPDYLFGLDVRPESLPRDVIAAARSLLASGNAIAALSLLYRGALVSLIHRAQVEFRAGDTEGNCLERVNGRIDRAAYTVFSRLLRMWQLAAYAHMPPGAAEMESLILAWSQHFGLSDAPVAPGESA